MAQVTVPQGSRIVDGLEVPEAGTYEIDRAHTQVEFVARYLMVSKVRGRFGAFSGRIEIAENPAESAAAVTVDAASIDTRDETRDAHLRSEDFLAVEAHPTLEFRSTGLEGSGDRWRLLGDLTIRGVTRPVALDVAYDGSAVDPWGNTRIAFTASTEVDREDWGLTWNAALETGGVLVGRRIGIELTVQATKVT